MPENVGQPTNDPMYDPVGQGEKTKGERSSADEGKGPLKRDNSIWNTSLLLDKVQEVLIASAILYHLNPVNIIHQLVYILTIHSV